MKQQAETVVIEPGSLSLEFFEICMKIFCLLNIWSVKRAKVSQLKESQSYFVSFFNMKEKTWESIIETKLRKSVKQDFPLIFNPKPLLLEIVTLCKMVPDLLRIHFSTTWYKIYFKQNCD